MSNNHMAIVWAIAFDWCTQGVRVNGRRPKEHDRDMADADDKRARRSAKKRGAK